jgi:hypothetical protein
MGAIKVRRWAKHFKDGNTGIQNQPPSGRLRIASTKPNKKTADEIIKEDGRVTLDAIANKLGTWHNAAQDKIGSLGYRKMCASWVQHLLTETHKVKRKAITSEILRRYQDEGDNFLLSIVTGDESWFHHYDPEMKQQSME